MDYVAMGRRIRSRRKEMRMNQAVLSEKVDISISFLGHIERGSRKPSMDTIVKLANALQCGVDNFVVDSLAVGLLHEGFTDAEKHLALDLLELIRQHRNNV